MTTKSAIADLLLQIALLKSYYIDNTPVFVVTVLQMNKIEYILCRENIN